MYSCLSEDEKSSYTSQQPIYGSENYIYELFNKPESQSELDSVDNGRLYFTDNKTEKISEQKITLKKKKIYLNIINKTQPSTSNIFKEKYKETIFIIKKVKHLGRKRKNQKSIEQPKHTKFSKDNIMIKIKKDFSNDCLDFFNSLLKKSGNEEINKLGLKKIDTSILKQCQKNINERFLKMPFKELLSQDISKKFTKSKKDENKKKNRFNIKAK